MKPELALDLLPIWRGVQKKPEYEVAPFSLSVDENGYIYQSTDSHVVAKLERAYSDVNYQFITQPPGGSAWSNRIGKTYISYLTDAIGDLTQKSILEIGAGSLFIAQYITDAYKTSHYLVVDPAVKEIPPKATAIEVRKEYFHADRIHGDFDLIMSFNTLEHIVEPKRFLQDVTQVLAPGGNVLLVFPEVSAQFARGDLNSILHEHVNYFTKHSAIHLFEESGFTVSQCDVFEEMLYVLMKVDQGNVRRGRRDSDTLVSLVSRKVSRNLKIASGAINRDLRVGKKVAFHGACNGLNNFIYLSGLQVSPNLYVFDSDESKENHYAPTLKTPIRIATDPSYKGIDMVYVAAMTYFDEIKQFLTNTHDFSPNQIRPLCWI